MTSLTQARLAPLSQRYLTTISTWRHDIREALASSDSELIGRLTSSLSRQTSEASAKQSVIIATHYNHSTRDLLRETNNTPRSLTCDNYLRSQALVGLKLGSPSFMNNYDDLYPDRCRGTSHSDFIRYQLRKCKPYFDGHLKGLELKMDRYLSETLQTTSIALEAFDKQLASSIHEQRKRFTRRVLVLSRSHEQRDRSGGGDHTSECGTYFRPLYVMLGVLGMFRKPSESELEEERVRMMDKEKIKKMKPIELAIAKGVLSMCDQNYGKANQFFHEALHMAQDDNDEEREDLILNLIASNYFESGDYQNAEKLFIDLMRSLITRDVAPTAPAILELSLKLASIYSKNRETEEKALKGFKFVISSLLSDLDEIVSNIEELDIQDISEEKRDGLALLGWSYDWFAKHLLIMNDYSGAATMLQKAHEISSKVLGPLHDQTLILLNDIGTTLAMNNSPDEGRTFIMKAVEGAIKNESMELASFYVNLGLVNLKLRNLEEAKRNCENSMELARKNHEHYNSQEIIELSRTCLEQVRRLLETEKQ